MKIFKFITYSFCITSFLIALSGCSINPATYRTETFTKKVPYEDTETVLVEQKLEKEYFVNRYIIADPFFPFSKSLLKIAVLPFTDSTGTSNKGIEIAEEIEFELLKRADLFSKTPKAKLAGKIYSHLKDNYCGIDKPEISDLIERNSIKRYEVINRTLISDIISESEILSLSAKNISKSKEMLGVDALITGHVRKASNGELSFIMKAIETNTTKVIFVERYSGSYEGAVKEAVDAFYFNIKRKEKDCSKYRKVVEMVPVERVVKKYRKETWRRKVCIPGKNTATTLVSQACRVNGRIIYHKTTVSEWRVDK